MNVHSNELVDMVNAKKIVNHYRDKTFFDLMTAVFWLINYYMSTPML